MVQFVCNKRLKVAEKVNGRHCRHRVLHIKTCVFTTFKMAQIRHNSRMPNNNKTIPKKDLCSFVCVCVTFIEVYIHTIYTVIYCSIDINSINLKIIALSSLNSIEFMVNCISLKFSNIELN